MSAIQCSLKKSFFFPIWIPEKGKMQAKLHLEILTGRRRQKSLSRHPHLDSHGKQMRFLCFLVTSREAEHLAVARSTHFTRYASYVDGEKIERRIHVRNQIWRGDGRAKSDTFVCGGKILLKLMDPGEERVQWIIEMCRIWACSVCSNGESLRFVLTRRCGRAERLHGECTMSHQVTTTGNLFSANPPIANSIKTPRFPPQTK